MVELLILISALLQIVTTVELKHSQRFVVTGAVKEHG